MGTLSRCALLALLASTTFLARPAWAEESAGEEVDEGGSTIQRVVEEVTSQVSRLIGDLPRPRLDLAVVVNERSGTTGRLRQTLQELLLGQLSRGEPLRSVQGESGSAWSDRGRARSTAATQGFELLLWVEVVVEDNHLVVEGMVFETEHHLWREAVAPERQVLGQVFSRTRVNAEIRHYLTPLSSGPLSSTPIPLGRATYLALAVADIDGDDLTELVLLNDRALEIRSLRHGQAELVAQLKLAGLPRAATRSRDSIGTVAVGPAARDGGRAIALRTSDYSQGMVVRFDGQDIQLQGTVTDFPIRWETELECTTLTPGRNTFQTAAIPCGSLEETATVPPFSATVREPIHQPAASPVVASATSRDDGTVALSWNDREVATVSPFGTALAISDINDDGVAEVLLSSDRDPGSGDELTILRLSEEGVTPGREQLGDISGSVWIAAAGDVDNDGLRELLAISQNAAGAELLVIE